MRGFRGEYATLDEAARAEAPGRFVKLSDGYTHYEVGGPSAAPPVILVHGFSVPYFIWDPTFEGLVKAGFRVVRYDLFGRGYSDRPDTTYDQALYARQLAELIAALELPTPLALVGLSMGGAIVVGFTADHPALVDRLALIAPAGISVNLSWSARLLRLPLLGDWLMDRFGERVLLTSLTKDFKRPELLPTFQARYRTQMRYRGFRYALLSTMRHGPLGGMEAAYRRVGEHGHPVLLIWGREDTTVPFAASERVLAAIPQAEFHPIEGAGHIPHYEQPEVVMPILVDFLRRPRHPATPAEGADTV